MRPTNQTTAEAVERVVVNGHEPSSRWAWRRVPHSVFGRTGPLFSEGWGSRRRPLHGGLGYDGVAVLELIQCAEGADDHAVVGLEPRADLDPALVADAR